MSYSVIEINVVHNNKHDKNQCFNQRKTSRKVGYYVMEFGVSGCFDWFCNNQQRASPRAYELFDCFFR